jgi:chaperonin GroEL (HSP60 family)
VVQVGDGTTTVVLLASEFLKEAKAFIDDGVHPRVRHRSILVVWALCITATIGGELNSWCTLITTFEF